MNFFTSFVTFVPLSSPKVSLAVPINLSENDNVLRMIKSGKDIGKGGITEILGIAGEKLWKGLALRFNRYVK